MALAILAVRGGQGSVPETTGDIHCITFTAKRRGCRQIRPKLTHDRRRWQPLPRFHIPPRRRVTASQPTVAVSKVAALQGMGVQASRIGTPPSLLHRLRHHPYNRPHRKAVCNERSSAWNHQQERKREREHNIYYDWQCRFQNRMNDEKRRKD